MRLHWLVTLVAAWAAPAPAGAPASAPRPEAVPHSCETDPDSHRLDFWVGSWTVYDPGGARDGRNVIEKILGGCAIVENWHDASGGEGKSLFYRPGPGGEWKQVWVTDLGFVKEKSLVRDFAGDGIRFQGAIQRGGQKILDRTTLIALPDGRVRQLIEQSRDGGATWRTGYEGLYVRDKAPAQ